MEKFDIFEYKGFKTDFFIMPKTKNYLDKKNITLTTLMRDYFGYDEFHWYEHYLFDILDPVKWYEKNKNTKLTWSPEKETRKNFKFVFCGITEKWENDKRIGFDEKFEFKKENLIAESSIIVGDSKSRRNKFAVRFKVSVIKND